MLDECIDEFCAAETADGTDIETFPTARNVEAEYDDDNHESLTSTPVVGDMIDVYWPLDHAFCTGKLQPSTKMTTSTTWCLLSSSLIDYVDGEMEILDLAGETWKYSSDEVLDSNNINFQIGAVKSSARGSLLFCKRFWTQLFHEISSTRATIIPFDQRLWKRGGKL